MGKLNITWNDVWKVVALGTLMLNFTTFKTLLEQGSYELIAGAVGVAVSSVAFALTVFFKRK